jgi:hypothetical protein
MRQEKRPKILSLVKMKQKSSAKYVSHLKLRGKSKVQTVQETAFILEHRKKEWWNIK